MGKKGVWWKVIIWVWGVVVLVGCGHENRPSIDVKPATIYPMEAELSPDIPKIRPTTTITPFPSLSTAEVDELIDELMKTNGGCELPCWWGMTPGITSKQEAQLFFKQFEGGVGFSQFVKSGGTISDVNRNTGFKVSVGFTWEEDVLWYLDISAFFYTRPEFSRSLNQLEIDNPLYYEIMADYTLENVLSEYGQPSQVFVKTYNLDPRWYPTNTQLLYLDKGILFGYQSRNTMFDIGGGEIWISTCPSIGLITLRLFKPSVYSSNPSLADIFGFNYSGYSGYKYLENATNMTVEEFTEVFQNPNCDVLLETPAEIWSEQGFHP